MKKAILLFLMCFSAITITVNAEVLDSARIDDLQQIGDLYRALTSSGEEYVVDSENNILGGPYKQVSDNSGYCYVKDSEGNKIMFDLDGTILAKASADYDINTPCNGIYTIRERKKGDQAELIIYDYKTRTELLRTTGHFWYYLEQQSDKMFIKSNGKYAIVDNKCNFITDYIYDDVKKRFNPEYVPFPKSYAIVVQDSVEKYIDWDLNEINLNDYNGEPFVTNCRHMRGSDGFENYKDYYVLESGDRYALYDMAEDKILIPYQNEYSFKQMNDKYIIIAKDKEEAVLDYSGNIVVPYSKSTLYLNEEGLVSYHYYAEGVSHEGVVNPEDGTLTDKPLDRMGYFYQVLGEEDRESIAFGTIVSGDRAADIREEDLQKFLDTYWNFSYERVIAPPGSYSNIDTTYIKLWNKDRTKSHVIYTNSGVIMGTFGEPAESHGETKMNYVMYQPVMGNGRNALYTAFETVRRTYFDEGYEGYIEAQRDIAEADRIEIPVDNLLPIDNASEWAKSEIQKAAACNLLIYELTDKYTENITRLEFCKLAYRAIATEFDPNSDSRTGVGIVIQNVINERGITIGAYINKFTDCYYNETEVLASMGIIQGMGDGTFAPDAFITREQAATILCRMAEFLGNKTMIEPQNKVYYSYDGHLISDWAEDSVKTMHEMGIMKGVGENEFSPQGMYTAEQAIATMLRLYECY